jgi:two-component system, chemotaxis family, sensor kinase CheA
MSDDALVVREFLAESRENLDRLDNEFVEMERNPENRALYASAFRTLHTLKGTAGFLGFGVLQRVAHAGEDLLAELRDGRRKPEPAAMSVLLEMVDAIRAMLAQVEQGGTEGTPDVAPLLGRVEALRAAPAQAAPGDGAPADPASGAPAAGSQGEGGNAGAAADRTLRVDVALLDRLMNLVGELVLARNQIVQSGVGHEDATLLASTQRLNLITTELQEAVMRTRMQPIATVWRKLPRVVRDLAVSCGKRVRLHMEGEETDLDKTLIECIRDPLTHAVRNAVDHGIETPAERRAAGKPEEGLLTLRAYHEGGQVIVEIGDDGRGVDPEKVRQQAVAKGLVSADQARRTSDRELSQLLFLPGFSTAERVSNVSGRGVGMDVVRTRIEAVGGSVDLASVPGAGATLRLRIPLTLAIIPALMVNARGECFAIPQVNLLELVRVDPRQSGIERIQDTPVYRLRGKLLPLVMLEQTLGLSRGAAPSRERELAIVVLDAEGRQFGLVVDDVTDTEEIVVKPLGRHLKGVSTYTGATILGDGRVALILDVMGLAQHAHVVSDGRDNASGDSAEALDRGGEDAQTLLLFRVGADQQMGVALSLVARLEEVPRARVERAGGRSVIQYRGEIMPLIPLREVFGQDDHTEPPATLQVVVYNAPGGSVGLVVDEVVDIVEETVAISEVTRRTGVFGSAVVRNRVTDLVDLELLVKSELPALFAETRPA